MGELVSFLILTYSHNQDRYLPQPTPLLQNQAQPLLPKVFNLLFVSLLDQPVYFDFEKGINDVDEITVNTSDKDKTAYEL